MWCVFAPAALALHDLCCICALHRQMRGPTGWPLPHLFSHELCDHYKDDFAALGVLPLRGVAEDLCPGQAGSTSCRRSVCSQTQKRLHGKLVHYFFGELPREFGTHWKATTAHLLSYPSNALALTGACRKESAGRIQRLLSSEIKCHYNANLTRCEILCFMQCPLPRRWRTSDVNCLLYVELTEPAHKHQITLHK